MEFNDDFFALFGLARQYRLETSDLEGRYRDVQTRVHPDRYAQASETDRRVSMQWATRANEAYQTLRKPMERARYLLTLHGIDLQAENNTAMPADFLFEQMEWREATAEARAARDIQALEELHERLRDDLATRYVHLAELLDDQADFAAAADRVRRLMFLEKLLNEIDDAIASLDE